MDDSTSPADTPSSPSASSFPSLSILIADDEGPARFGMRRALQQPGYEILEAENGAVALELIRSRVPDLVFLDLDMPQLDGRGLLRELGNDARGCEIVIVTANDSVAAAVECLRLGAADYITKPFEVDQLRAISRRVAARVELQRNVDDLRQQIDEKQAFGALIGVSRPMRQLYQQMLRVARTSADVLLRGESGTGKELIAREIHRLSPRASGPFIAVNTAAIPESLTESELFGHQKGAFTGADAVRQGVFEQAHGGTLFLDEIGDMPLPAQAKVLRTLQERVVQPVGSSRSIPVNVRVITATHQDLEESIREGRFRHDLYFRVKGIELHVPPLRSRREDILLLANYFLERRLREYPQAAIELARDAVDSLLAHPWPGNVRELEHAMQRAFTLAEGTQIKACDLGLSRPATDAEEYAAFSKYSGLPLTEAKARLVEDFERVTITAALEEHNGNISAAARQLGMHRQSLQQKMAQLGLVKP